MSAQIVACNRVQQEKNGTKIMMAWRSRERGGGTLERMGLVWLVRIVLWMAM